MKPHLKLLVLSSGLIFVFTIFFSRCTSESPQNQDVKPVEERNFSIGYDDFEKERTLRSRLLKQKDSIFTTVLESDQVSGTRQYQLGLTFADSLQDFLKSNGLQTYRNIQVKGKTGSGYRKIYFPVVKSDISNPVVEYPAATVIVCENVSEESGKTIDYEVMVKVAAGWEFYLLTPDFQFKSESPYYQYPTDCMNCHYEDREFIPFYKFTQYLNLENPITGHIIDYDGFVSAEQRQLLKVHRKSDGVFGPYLKLFRTYPIGSK